jgi:hypothetical protein
MSNDPQLENKIVQKGIWEYLLCSDCDNIKIGKYDKYAFEFCKKAWDLEIPIGKNIVISEVNYKALRLFQLSLLWRAMISQKKEFDSVKFHPKHEKRIKEIIYNETLGEYYEYGCLMYLLVDKNKILNYVMVTPHKFNYKGFSGVAFTFGGFVWTMLVNSHMEQFPLKKYLLKPESSLTVRKTEYYSLKSTLSLIDQFAAQGKIKLMSEYYNKKPKI